MSDIVARINQAVSDSICRFDRHIDDPTRVLYLGFEDFEELIGICSHLPAKKFSFGTQAEPRPKYNNMEIYIVDAAHHIAVI